MKSSGVCWNEGAFEGILVTTGYAQASYQFAPSMPLELLDDANLLALLAEHARDRTRIVIRGRRYMSSTPEHPEQWSTDYWAGSTAESPKSQGSIHLQAQTIGRRHIVSRFLRNRPHQYHRTESLDSAAHREKNFR
jgi:hypothetical protein